MSNASESFFSGSVSLLIITAKFWRFYYRIRAKPNFGPKYGQHAKHCHRPVIHPFPLVYFCVSCVQHFGVLTVKFLLNQITTHMMDNLQNNVTRLRIIVLYYSYSAHHQNDTWELFPWNGELNPLWRKTWPICKVLSHSNKSLFTLSYLVLIVRQHFEAFIVKFSQNCITA